MTIFAVGGLGLNLTSADTLVFMEHDWNPMRDHQVIKFTCPVRGLLTLLSNFPAEVPENFNS